MELGIFDAEAIAALLFGSLDDVAFGVCYESMHENLEVMQRDIDMVVNDAIIKMMELGNEKH